MPIPSGDPKTRLLLVEAADLIDDLVGALGEARDTFGELLATLRKEAPGTPLNNHRFDGIGLRANNALAKIDAALAKAKP